MGDGVRCRDGAIPVVEHREHETTGRRLPVVVWRCARPVLAVSSAPLGGGLGRRAWVINVQVPATYDRVDPAEHLAELAGALGLVGPGVGMLTAVDLGRVHSEEDGGAWADVSVGTTHPTWAADVEHAVSRSGPVEAVDQVEAVKPPGTINIVAFVPERLSPAALVNAVATATEAKTQALREWGVLATGTASDAMCIACAADGAEDAFGGPRSRWGARLARAVHRAVLAGLAAEAAR